MRTLEECKQEYKNLKATHQKHEVLFHSEQRRALEVMSDLLSYAEASNPILERGDTGLEARVLEYLMENGSVNLDYLCLSFNSHSLHVRHAAWNLVERGLAEFTYSNRIRAKKHA